jgi:hypothetical protein
MQAPSPTAASDDLCSIFTYSDTSDDWGLDSDDDISQRVYRQTFSAAAGSSSSPAYRSLSATHSPPKSEGAGGAGSTRYLDAAKAGKVFEKQFLPVNFWAPIEAEPESKTNLESILKKFKMLQGVDDPPACILSPLPQPSTDGLSELSAISLALKYISNRRKFAPIPPIRKRDTNPEAKVSLREIAKRHGSVVGEIFTSEEYARIAYYLGYATQTFEDPSDDKVFEHIRQEIAFSSPVIIFYDSGHRKFHEAIETISQKEGINERAAVIVGYATCQGRLFLCMIQDKNYIIAPAKDVIESSRQLTVHKRRVYQKGFYTKVEKATAQLMLGGRVDWSHMNKIVTSSKGKGWIWTCVSAKNRVRETPEMIDKSTRFAGKLISFSKK